MILNAKKMLGGFVMSLAMGLGLAGNSVAMDKPTYTALYVFGDSYSDMGARYLDGNGPTVPAYLATQMGISLTYPLDPAAAGKSLNFAATAASSGVDKGTDEWCCKGMTEQVNEFAAKVRSGALAFKPETTLFLLEGGLNDTTLPTETTVANIKQQIKTLQSLGARHISLSLLPTQIPAFAKIGVRLNPAYEQLVSSLKGKSGAEVGLNHWGAYLDEILQHPKKYGIVNTTAQCAGRELFKEDPTPCAKPETYFYFHSSHPSTAVNKIVAQKLCRELTGAECKSGPAM